MIQKILNPAGLVSNLFSTVFFFSDILENTGRRISEHANSGELNIHEKIFWYRKMNELKNDKLKFLFPGNCVSLNSFPGDFNKMYRKIPDAIANTTYCHLTLLSFIKCLMLRNNMNKNKSIARISFIPVINISTIRVIKV
jgi:hypothetical protein